MDIKIDKYRLYGNKNISTIKAFNNHAFLYMFCWRKVVKQSRGIIFFKLVLKILRMLYHIEIPYTVTIGHGFSMDHAFDITVNSRAIIGNNVSMYKGSTIGMTVKGVPTIGDRVYIATNATIIGNIKIGNDVLISANSFVNFDVPDHSVVIGNPGVIYHKVNASSEYLLNIWKENE